MTDDTLDEAVPAAEPVTGAEDAPDAGDDATASATSDWTAEYAPDERDFIAVKGWRAPSDLLQSYRHLERLVGSDTVRIPGRDAPVDEIDAFWSRLGRPETPADYDISAPSDMAGYSQDMQDWFRDVAHECRMPTEMAQRFHDKYVEKFVTEASGLAAGLAEARQHTEAELRANWGVDYDRKQALADRALQALGGDRLVEELRLTGLDTSAALTEAFAAAGEQLLSEDGLEDDQGSQRFGHTPDSARQEIRRLRADAEFMNIYGDRRHAEHEAAQQRMDQLYAIAREGG